MSHRAPWRHAARVLAPLPWLIPGLLAACTSRTGFAPLGTARRKEQICGNGTREGTEVCDDGNTVDGDGCDATCQVEAGWRCVGAKPSQCTLPTAADVFFSVGQNTTDHEIGTPTIDIKNGVATFSVAQTASTMGVGDVVTYDGTSVAYVAGKLSDADWDLVTANGTMPADITGATVDSITHAFDSLAAAQAGIPALLGTSDLLAGNYVVNIPCYFDSGPDTTPIVLAGWTTSPTNYMRIYTPRNTATECNRSQRHTGKWDDTAYNIQIGDSSGILVEQDDVVLDGLQIWNVLPAITQSCIAVDVILSSGTADITLSHNIFRGSPNNTAGTWMQAYTDYPSTISAGVVKIFDNIAYDYATAAGWSAGFEMVHLKHYLYNNTAINCGVCYRDYADALPPLAINDIAQQCSVDTFQGGGFDAASDYNVADGTTVAPGAHSASGATVSFVDFAGGDFHLSPTDLIAKDAGTDLSHDPYVPFDDDIDGDPRPQGKAWDIGADEARP